MAVQSAEQVSKVSPNLGSQVPLPQQGPQSSSQELQVSAGVSQTLSPQVFRRFSQIALTQRSSFSHER
jgi:hypothetical protein